MAFDQSTRNRLARFVGETRFLLSEEFTRQLQNEYGMDPESGAVTELEKLTALDDSRRETARILRETLEYYLAGKADDKKNRQETLQRIVREQAFTVLNRLCALRMAESRGILIESIAQGYQSKGFLLYARLAGAGLGETGDAYRTYLFSLFDEFAVDLAALFDRFNPQGRLFPRETALLKVTALINDPEIDLLWAEDETIGWIYQYFNSKEERKAMRDASQAPRNSRELAVRNQFFTPRYVVEFLTDNTLGRIWYEMTKGATALKDACQYLVRRPNEIFLNEGAEAPVQASDEALSQEELLRQPAYIPHRPLKDPREIKMLDPACGSMHFGLYAFDLFEQIYAEAWDLEESLGEDALWRLADLDSLHKTYPNRAAFLHDVPRLIIERNIHGVDIDPRAVQIAGLSLWLRAQKSWQAQGVRPQDRPQIHRSNIVCAEPMPGDRAMLEEFLGTLKEDRLEALMRQAMHVPAGQKVRATKAMAAALGKLVRVIWQEMELAGEAGSLLKIEETLREAIAEARKESEEKSPLFQAIEFSADAGEEKLGFWDQAETLTLTALQNYAEQAAEGQSYRRRLFAGDAAHGFAFIDLCSKIYDVTLMNPPFGLPTPQTEVYAKEKYIETWQDIYSCFFERMLGFTKAKNGFVGGITPKSYYHAKGFRGLRRLFEKTAALLYSVDIGGGVLDAAVEVCFSVLKSENSQNSGQSIFINFVRIAKNNISSELLNSIENLNSSKPNSLITLLLLKDKNGLPNEMLPYRFPSELINLLRRSQLFEPNFGSSVVGLTTFDNDRFIRIAWEIPEQNEISKDWIPVAMGGGWDPFYSEFNLFINWKNNAAEMRENEIKRYQTTARTTQSRQYWFLPGLTFSKISSLGFSVQPLPAKSVFTSVGFGIFPTKHDLWTWLGFFNSKPVCHLMSLYSADRHWASNSVASLPIPEELNSRIGDLAKQAYILRETVAQASETSPHFAAPINLDLLDINKKYQHVYEELNTLVSRDLGFSEQTHTFLEENAIYKGLDFGEIEIGSPFDILSYAFGCILGRWDIRFMTGEKKMPEISDPFSILPVFPPGILYGTNRHSSLLKDVANKYPIEVFWNGILDNDYLARNIEYHIRNTLQVFLKGNLESVEQNYCKALGVSSLHEYFQKPSGFFDDHLKRYSKSRRQAPIYWQVSTPSNSYSLWLYYHRLNDQTLFTCVNDFVDPKIKQVSEEAKSLRVKKSRSSSDERELERLTDFERELKDFRDELLRVAKFWKPNLNDGVQITAAPLWKLFQHRPWQKKLKETWESLEAGEYDWSHLAYSIWTDRVREKCKTDKSLAIAHDLEHVYVEPQVPLKKKAGRKKKIETDEMFDEDN